MTDTLPANRSSAVQPALPELDAVEADYFDGWTPADVRAEVIRHAPGLQRAEVLTEQYRRLVGLGLYRVLVDEGERAGSEFVAEVVRATGISSRTIGNWRRAAMDAFSLPPPNKRSAAASRPSPRGTRGDEDPISAPSTVIKPPAAPPTRDPRTPGVKTDSPNTTPRPRRERLHAGCPTCTCPIPTRSPEPAKRDPSTCSHPIMRRTGPTCQLCDARVGSAGTFGAR